MNHNVKRLFDIEIDEVSVVDRPANQHGLIAFAKNDSFDELETGVPEELFDETGEEIPVEVLEHGDIVFDAEGNEFVYVEDEDEEDDDDVEKGIFGEGLKAAKNIRMGSTEGAVGAFKTANQRGAAQGLNFFDRTKRGLKSAYKNSPGTMLAGGAGAAAIGGTGYAFGKAEMSNNMSLGDSVLEELSKRSPSVIANTSLLRQWMKSKSQRLTLLKHMNMLLQSKMLALKKPSFLKQQNTICLFPQKYLVLS